MTAKRKTVIEGPRAVLEQGLLIIRYGRLKEGLRLAVAHMQIAADSFQKLNGARNGR